MDPWELTVADLDALDDSARGALTDLLRRADDACGHPPLPEPQRRAVAEPGTGRQHARVVLSWQDGALRGCAMVSTGHDGSAVVHVVVDPTMSPDRVDDVRSTLVQRARSVLGPGTPTHLWVMQADAADDARARAQGFSPERDLLQMRVPLPLPPDIVAASRPLVTRPFVPGRDEEAWLATNNRAFATHPEQGGWTLEQLRERLAADWVELAGFLVADDPGGAGLLGSCWTKVHRHRTPVLGEIYVISVDPRFGGQGWGRSLTVAGLEWLAGRGVRHGMLYVDASNQAAVALYRSLGFTVDHVDRSYRDDSRSAETPDTAEPGPPRRPGFS